MPSAIRLPLFLAVAWAMSRHIWDLLGLACSMLRWAVRCLLRPQWTGDVYKRQVRCCEYQLPGTQALADEAMKTIGDKANACMLRSHGLVCIGARCV